MGILIFKGVTARRLYKSFGFKELIFRRVSYSREGERQRDRETDMPVWHRTLLRYDFKAMENRWKFSDDRLILLDVGPAHWR
jgi:hypothetical protein